MKPLPWALLHLLALVVLAGGGVGAAESYQPKSNVTRGIYAHINRVVRASVWDAWGSGFEFVDANPHGGEACIRCVGTAGARGQGVGQTIQLDQAEPKPVKIAGWSRCKGVRGEKSYHYSLYVDFVFTDGKPWHMKLATFNTGTHGWQYAETVVTPPKPLRSARFWAFIRETEGVVWFDDLFLGEAGGENLLQCPGFEKRDRFDLSRREKLFADLTALHCNAVHGYLSSSLEDWDRPPANDSEVVQFLEQAHRRGIGVWLTVGLGGLPIRDAADPDFPQYHCVNGPWGRRWTQALARIARYPFAGLSMVPDEWNWNNHRLKRQYLKHRDPKVRAFYRKLGSYCDCPVCRKRFAQLAQTPWPKRLPGPDPAGRRWLRFRYDSTTDWLERTCAAVKKANPSIRTDSLICVTPICSDLWYGPGVAWDRLGDTGLDYATTDPYIQLHNYLGDSTHWYVTETAEHLAAANAQRRCGVVLEASRLRPDYRELDPVEIYGSALSAVWHGADELAWWHHTHVMGVTGTTKKADVSQACVAGVYSLLEKIDPWLDGLTPEPGVAFLFSRASCDLWRLYLQAKDARPPFNTRGITDPRYAAIVQKEVLYLLLRTGVPTTLYYLESVRKEELAKHKVVVVPFPVAISKERADLIQALYQSGKRILICGADGPLDEDGTPHKGPVLFDRIRGSSPARNLEELLTKERTDLHLTKRTPGAGMLAFVPPRFLRRLCANRDNEKRTRKERILPSRVDREAAARILGAIRYMISPAVVSPLMEERFPEGGDVELCLSVNRRGEKLFLAINWDSRERSVTLVPRPCFRRPPRETYRLGLDGRWRPWKGKLLPELRLGGQNALVARLRP